MSVEGPRWKRAATRLVRSDWPGRRRLLRLHAERLIREAGLAVAEWTYRPARMDYEPMTIVLRQSSRMAGRRLTSVAKEPFTVDWIERYFRPGDVFYDAGANVGAYSLVAAKSSGGLVPIYAFEPSGPSYHDLCLNIALNGCSDAITPLPLALWSSTTLIPFAHYSLEPGSSKHTFDFDQRRGEGELLFRQQAPAISIDDAVGLLGLPPPTHLKIDTEGSELQVLEGARQALAAPGWRSILTEVADGEEEAGFDDLLGPFGFRHAESYRRRKGGVAYALYLREPVSSGSSRP